jgi:DNA-binding NarL/FixJ family response regulator
MNTANVPLRIIIADDQAVAREGLALLLGGLPDIDLVGTATDGAQALALVAEQKPDAILLDLQMPVVDGISAAQRLASEFPSVAVVILTTFADQESVLGALRAGARGYLTKDEDLADVVPRALRAAAGRLVVLGGDACRALLAPGEYYP